MICWTLPDEKRRNLKTLIMIMLASSILLRQRFKGYPCESDKPPKTKFTKFKRNVFAFYQTVLLCSYRVISGTKRLKKLLFEIHLYNKKWRLWINSLFFLLCGKMSRVSKDSWNVIFIQKLNNWIIFFSCDILKLGLGE